MKIPENVKKELECNEVQSFVIPSDRVRVVNTKKDKEEKVIVFFTLVLNGVTINNCNIAQTKDGKDFISFPSRKDNNGQYRTDVFFVFSDEDTALIIKELERILETL